MSVTQSQSAVLLSLLLGIPAVLSCKTRALRGMEEQSAEFGVFFGGQIQERERIRFELDPSRQMHGFRIQFSEPLTHPIPVAWEFSLPNSARSAQKKEVPARVIVAGNAEIQSGERQFEKSFRFQPGDPLGLWNVRVTSGDHVLIDRPFLVESPNDETKRSGIEARP